MCRLSSTRKIFEDIYAWYRLAFVAEVTEIRLLKPSEKIFDEVTDAATQVAVLRVRVIGRANNEGIKDTSVIFVPIDESRELWQQRIDRKTEMVFEHNRIGKREFVMKFGC
ncbi:MAG: hypothetical protein EA381_07300 [Planctomycetaceae bacterium]|nr:MAG: hypothetical protein EA381_07300 [Planctomycetaceae bacterium]